MQMRTGPVTTGIWAVIWSVEESITATVLDNLVVTNKDSALADETRAQTMNSKGRRHLTNAIAFAVKTSPFLGPGFSYSILLSGFLRPG
jgi:hypothetical protein